MDSSGPLRVLLVDDHELFRKGIASLLSYRPNVQIVGEANDGNEAIELTRQAKPDLVLMDVHMPRCDGIEALQVIKRESPNIKVIMLSAFDGDDELFAAIKNGADGYLLKDLDTCHFFSILDGLRSGVAPFSGMVTGRILQRFRMMASSLEHPAAEHPILTPAETELIELLVKGRSNKELADALHISENTVKLHLHNTMEKLHLDNRLQLAVYALKNGLVERPPDNNGAE